MAVRAHLRFLRHVVVSVGVGLLAPVFVEPASAQPGKAPPPKPKPALDVGAAIKKLKSGEDAQIRAGLDELRGAGATAGGAAAAVSELLTQGQSVAVTQLAIETLGELESPDGSAVLARYASHRTVALRRGAVKALTRTKGAAATGALKKALGDADAQVRGNAAAGLGAMKAKDAVPDLFVALDHKVNEAAASIGQLCNAEQCEQLAGKLGKLPFDIVTSGLDQILFRPAADASDDTKIKVLGRLRELGTAEANKFLKDVETRLPKEASPRVRQALEQAVKATTGGSQ